MSRLARWRARARALRNELVALYLAYRDPRTPWYARLVAAGVLAYALSPIDLIPDPVPLLGYLDDLLLLPLGIALALRLIPPAVLADARATARSAAQQPRTLGWLGATGIALLWLAAMLAAGWLILRLTR
ncbi:YkvA family protein [Kallotenue papyrolyticum]|uniref:YkvA family protein n=1 Tax=Kallotenue papyrolyticum TaxID=1325125 RepID=UPI0004922D5B|nr:DUF1232 domain-containing protein [Kallotenue papyrolyticum]